MQSRWPCRRVGSSQSKPSSEFTVATTKSSLELTVMFCCCSQISSSRGLDCSQGSRLVFFVNTKRSIHYVTIQAGPKGKKIAWNWIKSGPPISMWPIRPSDVASHNESLLCPDNSPWRKPSPCLPSSHIAAAAFDLIVRLRRLLI
jgi:hypothetical protein